MNDVTREIAKIHLSGDVIPPIWFQTVKKASGRPDVLAVLILANIVYWYQPIDRRDEETGRVLPGETKFTGDMLKRSYDDYAKYYGIPKEKVMSSFNTLERLGLVVLHYRTEIIDGVKHPNTMYVVPEPKTVLKFTHNNPVKAYVKPPQNELNLEKPKVKESYLSEAEEIIQYLNDARSRIYKGKSTPQGYKLHTGDTMKNIRARLKDGFTVSDFKKVIDLKCDEWGDDDRMKMYIRPATLFTKSHFGDYLVQYSTWKWKRKPKQEKSDLERSIDGLMK